MGDDAIARQYGDSNLNNNSTKNGTEWVFSLRIGNGALADRDVVKSLYAIALSLLSHSQYTWCRFLHALEDLFCQWRSGQAVLCARIKDLVKTSVTRLLGIVMAVFYSQIQTCDRKQHFEQSVVALAPSDGRLFEKFSFRKAEFELQK